MSLLDQIVDVTITTSPAPISTTNYGVPLILGSTNPGWSDLARTYTSADALLTDGYDDTDPEYIAAAALYSGEIVPSQFLVAPRTHGNSAQLDTFDLGGLAAGTLNVGLVYSFTVDGHVVSYTSQANDTAQQVLGAFSTQLNALGGFSPVIANSGGIKVLQVTATPSNVSHIYTAISSNLNHVSVSQASSIANDLAGLAPLGNTWYGLLTPGATGTEVLQAAAWVEANKKLYVASNPDAANFDQSSTTSVAAQLMAAGYTRTALLPSPNGYADGIDAAWVGSNLPVAPGSNNWAYSALPGQTPDALTDSQISGALGKNANVFVNINGAHATLYGTTASGDYLDIVIGKDWLQSTIQANAFEIIRAASANGKKIPYTDKGASRIGQGVYAAIRQGIENQFIDGDQEFSVNIGKVADVPPATRARRQCPPITFSCVLAGAIDKVVITGVLDI